MDWLRVKKYFFPGFSFQAVCKGCDSSREDIVSGSPKWHSKLWPCTAVTLHLLAQTCEAGLLKLAHNRGHCMEWGWGLVYKVQELECISGIHLTSRQLAVRSSSGGSCVCVCGGLLDRVRCLSLVQAPQSREELMIPETPPRWRLRGAGPSDLLRPPRFCDFGMVMGCGCWRDKASF